MGAEGEMERVDVEMSEATHAFSIPLEFEPVDAVVDPDTWLLMRADVQSR